MKKIAIIALALCVLAVGVAVARPAGVFGFGPPPSYPATRQLVANFFALNLRDPESVQGLQISRPVAACHGRGHPGRRDVCGYRFCVAVNARNGFGGYTGRQVLVFWQYNGFAPSVYENQGICPYTFEPWTGEPVVEARDFCADQPKNEDCVAGKRENLVPLTVAESVGSSDSADGKPQACDDAFKDKLRAKGMSYADIDELCAK